MIEINIIQLEDVIEFQLAQKYSSIAREIVSSMSVEEKEVYGDSFIKVVDKIKENIRKAHTHNRYEDKIKFYTASKKELSKALKYWTKLMLKNNVINNMTYNAIKEISFSIRTKLNQFLLSIKKIEQ